MKKSLLAIFGAITLFFSCVVLVEARAEPGFKIGFQTTDGFRAGIFYNIKLGKYISIQPELNYTQRNYTFAGDNSVGWIWTSSFDPYQDNRGYDKARYIEIPVLLKGYMYKALGDFKPVLYIGGYSAYRVSSKRHDEDTGWYGNQRNYAAIDAGLIIGGGFEHTVGKLKFHYDVRYQYGLVNVLTNKPYWHQWVNDDQYETVWGEDEHKKNRSFSMSVGMSF